MQLLGEQLITDEVAAVSELVKNSYDANAPIVEVTLFHVSQPDGYIKIKDKGHGMTLQKLLSSWLELGTLSKARGKDMKPRLTEGGERVCLGEKGIGRLAVHKLGYITELVTKRQEMDSEIKLVIDWTAFENNEGFLQDVPVKWEAREPEVFINREWKKGTCITIRHLQKCWTKEMIQRVERSLFALKSPFADLSAFTIDVQIDDPLASFVRTVDISKLVEKATYTFTGQVDGKGHFTGIYSFRRPDLQMKRKKDINTDVLDLNYFKAGRTPICGKFKVRFYSWDLGTEDKKAVFGDTSVYTDLIKPNTGVKVFRDNFRVLPYGNEDNDWLSMDLERVKRFEDHISRNQVIAAIEISSEENPSLLDKTDREGIIDNQAFKDFVSVIHKIITTFEAERLLDRTKVKEITGRLHGDNYYKTTFTQNMTALSTIVNDQAKADAETKLKAQKLIADTKTVFDRILAKNEQPLLVAASIGLTYMMPTHEVQRDLHEMLRILKRKREDGSISPDNAASLIALVRQADSIVSGIGKLMQQTSRGEDLDPNKAVRDAVDLMRFKFKRNNIEIESSETKTFSVKGSDRLITIILLNFLDNSFYWLQGNKADNRKVKISIIPDEKECAIIVSDNGPGFEDDLTVVSLPFFTRKPNGMGLGLYIADRIVKMNWGKLKIFAPNSMPGLLPGANIGIILKKAEESENAN